MSASASARPSTRPSMSNLGALRSPRALERLTKALALLDAILEPEWEFRYYSFNSKWFEPETQRLATMRDGEGDEWLIAFSPEGAFLKGWAHESAVAKLHLETARFLEGLPPKLEVFANEPAFAMDTTTFCAWYPQADDGATWARAAIELPAGDDPDGSAELLSILDGDPETYQRYALAYYEEEIPLEAIRAIYAGQPLSEALLHSIDPERSIEDLAEDLAEIGWARADVN